MADPRMEYVQPYPTDLECVVCLTPWTDPVELNCKHVYCRSCTTQLTKCPTCRSNITSKQKAHFLMVNLVDALPVRCKECHYECSRERFHEHICGLTRAPSGSQNAIRAPSSSASPTRNNIEMNEWSKYNLTQDEYDHLCAVFLNFDDDDSGELDRAELTKLATWLNFPHRPADIERMFREMDQDRSNKLSLDEFCAYMKDKRPDPVTMYHMSVQDYYSVLMLFHQHDTNSDGQLSVEEFVDLCQSMGSPYPNNPNEARKLFHRIDENNSNSIDVDELLRYRSRTFGAQ